jgi:RNA polymerase sigma-70 factor (ECF subfamily)
MNIALDADRELRDRLAGGDQIALAELFRRHAPRLRRLVELRLDVRLSGRVSTADVLQEAYIDALKRLPHYNPEPEVPFFVWLRWVTIQSLIAVHRQHLGASSRDVRRERPIGHLETQGTGIPWAAELCADLTSPSHAAQRLEAVAFVRQAIDRLDANDREILKLRHFEQLSNQEAAVVLGIECAAATKRHARALVRLKVVLGDRTPLAASTDGRARAALRQ